MINERTERKEWKNMKPKVCGLISILVGLLFTPLVWGQVEPPETIKKIAPIIKGAKVVQSMQFQEGAQVVLEVSSSPKEVVAFYKDTMQKKGWNVVMQMDMQNNSMLNLAKENMNLMINASTNQKGKTMVQLLLQTNK
ncbi:MAG: hypothetical protein ACYS0I_13860 [Planctomycetota bacterium]|jgi:hypothetical protein